MSNTEFADNTGQFGPDRVMEQKHLRIWINDIGKYILAITYCLNIFIILLVPENLNAQNNSSVTVVFRYDDYGNNSPISLDIKLIDAFRMYKFPCTFSVIPYSSNETKKNIFPNDVFPITTGKVIMLKDSINDNTVEVALHGYSHEAIRKIATGGWTEFRGENFYDQRKKIYEGKKFLDNVIGQETVIFVPPWNSFDFSTILVLQELGFNCLSAGKQRFNAPFYSKKIKFLPATCSIKQLQNLISTSRNIFPQNAVIVVLFHSYDFIEIDKQRGVLSFTEFLDILYWLSLQKDVHVKSVGQTIKDSEEFDAIRYEIYTRFVRLNSLLPPGLNFKEGIYFSSEALKGLIIQILFYVFVFYVSITAIFCVLYIILYGKIKSRINVKGSIILYAWLVTVILISIYCSLRYETVTWKGLVVLSFVVGSAIGSIRAYNEKYVTYRFRKNQVSK